MEHTEYFDLPFIIRQSQVPDTPTLAMMNYTHQVSDREATLKMGRGRGGGAD